MSDVVIPTASYPALLDAFKDGLVAYAHPYVNDPPLGPNTVKADFVEVAWEGYEELPLDRLTPAYLRAGVAFCVIDPAIFQFQGGAEPLPIRGYYATENRNGRLLWAWRAPGEAVQLTTANPYLVIYCRFTYPPPAA